MTVDCNKINLNVGSTGRNVTEVQKYLKYLGYYNSTVDGSYGNITKQAVIDFQKAKNLVDDGNWGPITCKASCINGCDISSSNRGIKLSVFEDMISRFNKFLKEEKREPNFVYLNSKNPYEYVTKAKYNDMFKRYEAYVSKNKRKPETIYITEPTTSSNGVKSTGVKSTGWKTPSNIAQDNNTSINNGHTCTAFNDLSDIKRDDLHYAYTPNTGGVTKNHKSPGLYASNYGFNIPANAVISTVSVRIICQQRTDTARKYDPSGKFRGKSISKFELIKLKTGTSTTDFGVGNNKAPTKKLTYKKWPEEKDATYTYSLKDWGVELTPSMVNNSNFGCVIQFVGTEENGWTSIGVAKMQMNITYTIPTPQQIYGTREIKLKSVTINKQTDFDIDNPDAKQYVVLTWSHKGEGGDSPITVATGDNVLITHNKLKQFTLPVLHFKSSQTLQTYTQTFTIYPGTLVGQFSINVKNTNNESFTLPVTIVNTKEKVQGTTVRVDITDRLTDNTAYKNTATNQRILIHDCSIHNNTANRGGGAYITGEHYNIQRCSIKDNQTSNLVINWEKKA